MTDTQRCPTCGAPIIVRQVPVPKAIGSDDATLVRTYAPPGLNARERAVVEAAKDHVGAMHRKLIAEVMGNKDMRKQRRRAYLETNKRLMDAVAVLHAHLPDDADLLKEATDQGHQHGDR